MGCRPSTPGKEKSGAESPIFKVVKPEGKSLGLIAAAEAQAKSESRDTRVSVFRVLIIVKRRLSLGCFHRDSIP